MNPKDQADFLKCPRLDIGNRHKKRRLEIAEQWAAARDQEAVESLMTVVRDRQDDLDVRLAAVRVLGCVANAQAVSALAAILADQAAAELHLVAITALENIGTDKAVEALITALAQVKSSQQNAIRQALIQLGTDRTVAPLIAALGSELVTIHEEAGKILKEFGNITPRLIAALGHENDRVREDVRKLLVQIGAPVVPELITALDQADDRAREDIIETLVQIGKPSVEELLDVAIDENAKAAGAAVEVLSRIGEPALPALIGCLDDVKLGQKATQLVIRIGKPAVPALFQKLSEPDCTDQEIIIEIMCTISGMDRLTLAQAQYRQRIPLLTPLENETKALMLTRVNLRTLENMMSLFDSSEEELIDPPYGNKPDSNHVVLQLTALASIAPEFALPHYWLGQWYFLRLHDARKAISAFEQAARSQEFIYEHRKAKSYWWLGLCYSTPSPYFDFEKSLNYFRQTIEQGWDDDLIYQGIRFSADNMQDRCAQDKQPQLFLQAAREGAQAMSAYLERNPDDEETKAILKGRQELLARWEEQCARYGEAAFAEIRLDFLVNRAIIFGKENQAEKASVLLRQLLQEQPDNERVTNALIQVLLTSGRVDEALKQNKQYLLLQLKADPILRAADQHNRIGNYFPWVDKTLDNLIAQQHYAEALELLKDFESVVTSPAGLEEAPKLVEGIAAALCKLSFRYGKVAKASDLFEAYERTVESVETAFSISHDPQIVQNLLFAHRNIAEYLSARGQLLPAKEHLHRAVAVDPEYADGWWRLSMVYAGLQDGQRAMTCLQRAVALGDPDAIAMMATLTGR